MHIDPALVTIVGIALAVFAAGLLLEYLRQPVILAYLIAGVLLGPSALDVLPEPGAMGPLGEFGIILLLFFVGMEVRPADLIQSWRIAVFGTMLQIAVSVAVVWPLGLWFDWPVSRVLLLGFVISLSSTAVVVKLLQDAGQLSSRLGRHTLGILLVQDLAIVPMMLTLSLLGGEAVSAGTLALQGVGGVLVVALMVWVLRSGGFHLPLADHLKDHELGVFAAMSLCFGFALLTGLFGLSSVLGAFVAGLVVGAARETEWFADHLEPFHVLLVAFFFLGVGSMLDLGFLLDHIGVIALLVLLAFLTNTFINAVILRVLGEDWRHSLFAGAMLAQIGEFSFVLAAMGLAAGIIVAEGYQYTISTIALSLFFSPLWIAGMRRLVGEQGTTVEEVLPEDVAT